MRRCVVAYQYSKTNAYFVELVNCRLRISDAGHYNDYMTLTQFARNVRFIVKFGWLVVFVPFIVLGVFRYIQSRQTAPEAPPPMSNNSFGKLPELQMEIVDIPESTPTFRLDLIDASFPESGTIAGVYPIISAPYGFLSRDRALEIGNNLGFTTDPQIIDDISLVWRSGLRRLTVNATNLNFTYTFDYDSDLTVFRPGRFSSEQAATSEANRVMSGLGILGGSRGPDLSEGVRRTQMLRYDGNELVPTNSLAQASAAQVDYYRIPFNEIPVVSPQYYQSIVNVIISSVSENRTLSINYTYWEYSRNDTATYPIMGPEQAYTLFMSSYTNYVVFTGDATTGVQEVFSGRPSEVRVRDAALSYYDTREYQEYLQPVWVFKGVMRTSTGQTTDFVAYVPAITSDWIIPG